MGFRRKESFRFVFNEPLEASFIAYIDGKKINENGYPCEIFDISPRGMKLYTDLDIEANLRQHHIQFEVQFVLNVMNIQAIGDVIWSKHYANGKQYGLFFKEQSDIDDLIISEMKIRRKKEIFEKK